MCAVQIVQRNDKKFDLDSYEGQSSCKKFLNFIEKLCENLKIKSQKDKEQLKIAKDKVYLKGFYEGKMLVGVAAGESVEKAKPLVKQHLYDLNLACPYYEPEGEVVSRTGDQCIVASCY